MNPSTTTPFSAHTQQWAICVFDDLISFCGATVAYDYSQHFWNVFKIGVISPVADIRQASCYGVGVLADSIHHETFTSALSLSGENGSKRREEWTAQIIALLPALLQSCAIDGDENKCASENAVSAVGKILHYLLDYGRGAPDVCCCVNLVVILKVLERWVGFLPILEDEEEAPHTYGFILDIIHQFNAQQQPSLPSSINSKRILKLLIEVLTDGILSRF